jgi:hypothetical protein
MKPIGRTRWVIPEGNIPSQSVSTDRALVSHETACILNANEQDAHIVLTLFFADREPLGPYNITVLRCRTLHLRFNDLTDPSPVPLDTDYSSIFESDVPIVIQHTRLDSPVGQKSRFYQPWPTQRTNSCTKTDFDEEDWCLIYGNLKRALVWCRIRSKTLIADEKNVYRTVQIDMCTSEPRRFFWRFP